MPPVTPSAIFIGFNVDSQRLNLPLSDAPARRVFHWQLTAALVVNLAADRSRGWFFHGLYGRRRRSRHDPLHLAGVDLFFRDAAGFVRMRLHHRLGAILDLASAAGSYENVTVLAVEPIYRFHASLPVGVRTGKVKC